MHNDSPTSNLQLAAATLGVPAILLMVIVGFAAPIFLPLLMLVLVTIWRCAAVTLQRVADWAVDNTALAMIVDKFGTAGVTAIALRAILFVSVIPIFPLALRRLHGAATLPTHCIAARLLPAPILASRVA